jgi:uncharacterized RmlC-like cupin family protein
MDASVDHVSFPWACRGPLVRGEKAPRPDATAVTSSVSEDIVHGEIGSGLSGLHEDATRDCEICGLPMFPVAETDERVMMECANRHRQAVTLPTYRPLRERVRGWIARRGAQLHVQHERWEAEREEESVEQRAPRLVRASERRFAQGQTAGMVREEAVQTPGIWAGVVRTDAGRSSSWHHHGDHESVIFVVSGKVRLEYGPGGTKALHARTGDYLYLPPREIHREGNDGDEESEIVVVRSGTGELVVNVAGPPD